MAPFAFRIKAPAVRTIFPEPFVEGSPLLWGASTPNTREMNGRILKDDQGIVLIQYQDFVGVVDGTYYSPEKIGYHSLNNYHGWLVTKDEQLKQEFLLHASWLRDNLVLKNANGKTFGVWLYQYDYVYGSWLVLKKPWPSGLAQGRGLAALVHAWKVTGDNSYLKAARFAFEAFLIGSQSGGLRHDSPYGVWLPEYPGNTQPRYVLNGFCAAILGLFDYARLARDRRAEELYQRAVQTVARALPLYKTTQEGRQLSSYDLMKRPVEMLFSIAGDGRIAVEGATLQWRSHRFHLDIGSSDDEYRGNGSFVWASPHYHNWSQRLVRQGQFYRTANANEGAYGISPFTLLYPIPREQTLHIKIGDAGKPAGANRPVARIWSRHRLL